MTYRVKVYLHDGFEWVTHWAFMPSRDDVKAAFRLEFYEKTEVSITCSVVGERTREANKGNAHLLIKSVGRDAPGRKPDDELEWPDGKALGHGDAVRLAVEIPIIAQFLPKDAYVEIACLKVFQTPIPNEGWPK